MYKNRKYRSTAARAASAAVQSSEKVESLRESKSVLSPIHENIPAKKRRTDIEPPKVNQDEEEPDLLSSQCSVPPSQPPTQRRYLSQRSTLCRTQSKTMSRAPNSYFEMVLMKAGADLDEPDSYVLSCDHIVFVNRFRNQLFNHQDYPANLKTFMEGLHEAMDTHAIAVKLMSACTIRIQSTGTTIQSQDSLMMNFLMVEFLQKEIIEMLAEKIKFVSQDDKNLNTDPPLLPLMLSQLKFVATLHGDLLYEKIMEIYQNATTRSKKQIIAQAEYVLNSVHHDEFVQFLLNNTSSNEELLNPHTVQTFTNMFLTSKIQSKLRRKILTCMKEGCSTSLFPVFTKFLLKPGCEDDEVLPNLINDLRISLKFQSDRTDAGRKIQLDTFINIQQALTRSKKIFDTWQKVIQNVPANEIKPIDFMVLLMLMTIREDKFMYIENLFRRRIILEQFTVSTLNDVQKELLAIFDQHAETLLQMLHNFLNGKNHLVANFAKNSYKIIFTIDDDYQKKILTKLVEFACDKSLSQSTTISLRLLKDLNQQYSKEMQNCGLILLPLLDRIGDFTLEQSRLLMELLCSIAYPPPQLTECQMLQDHIDMLVKKQVISRTPLTKKQGIIGMVQLISHIVRTEESGSTNIYDLDATYNSAEDLPDGRAKIAAVYIGRIFASTVFCPNSLALFYDEMATIFSPCMLRKRANLNAIDRHFLVWLCDLTTTHFQNNFVLEDVPTGFNLEMAYENCINVAAEDISTDSELIPIAVNIAGCSFKLHSDSTSSIIVMPSLFNLMRSLHFIRYEGSLESINALLGCAVILPKLPGSIIDFDIFDEYDEVTSKKILDSYFHLVNWYREAISSFASQNEEMIRKKIRLRLTELIELEFNLRSVMSRIPSDYVPPVSNFVIDSAIDSNFKKPIGRAKKAAKNKPNANNKSTQENPETEGMSILATMRSLNATTNARVNPTKSKNNSKIMLDDNNQMKGIIYRQMDPDIMLILQEDLKTNYPIPPEERGFCIGLLEFRFILTDLVNKLESVAGIKPFSTDQLPQHISYPADLIKDLVKFLPKLMKHFKMLSNKIGTTLDSVKGALGNADLFTDEMNYIKICLGLCLRLFAALFSWSGFEEECENPVLKEALRGINNYSLFGTTPDKSIDELALLAFKKFVSLENLIVDIKSAVHLYHLVTSLKRFTNDLDTDKSIKALCKKLLCRKWYGYDSAIEKGAQCNLLLNELLLGFLKNSDYKRLKNILKLVIEETGFLKKKDDCLKMFPNFHKANFPMLFRCFCESLINIVQESIAEHNHMNLFKKWEQSCEILNMHLEIVKSLDIPRNFSLFLKYAHVLLKIFLVHGLSVFESGLRKDPERANELLKTLQVTTRFLHNLCCHSKAIKNTGIVVQIPALRETIENLVFRVKAALAANNCSSVFFMGNLRNKDLQGDEIRSQTSSISVPENAESDEDIPDDSCIDESIFNDEQQTSSKSGGTNKTRNLRENASRSKCF